MSSSKQRKMHRSTIYRSNRCGCNFAVSAFSAASPAAGFRPQSADRGICRAAGIGLHPVSARFDLPDPLSCPAAAIRYDKGLKDSRVARLLQNC